MATKLDKTIRREVNIDGQPYTVLISPEGLKLTEKGKRKGRQLTWESIATGEAELTQALRISVEATRLDTDSRAARANQHSSRNDEHSDQ